VIIGIERELHITTTGELSDAVHHPDGQIAHPLIYRIGKRQRGCDRDRIARVDSHGIEILDRAYNNDVADIVAQQFKLKLLPAQNALLHEYFVYRGCVETPIQRFIKAFRIVNESAAASAQRIRRPDHQREANSLADLFSLQERGGRSATADTYTQLIHL